MKPAIHLGGRLIVVTRPQPEASSMARLIETCHGIPLLAPAMEILPPRKPEPFLQAMAQIHEYDGVIITSVNGARAFNRALTQPPPLLFAVGKKTTAELSKSGHAVLLPEESADGIALAQTILQRSHQGQRFLFPRAEKGRNEIIEMLRNAGREVTVVDAYRAEPTAHLPEEAVEALVHGKVDALPLFSGRSAAAFLQALPVGGVDGLKNTVLVAMSPVTAQAMVQLGLRVDLISPEPSTESILTTLCRHWEN